MYWVTDGTIKNSISIFLDQEKYFFDTSGHSVKILDHYQRENERVCARVCDFSMC